MSVATSAFLAYPVKSLLIVFALVSLALILFSTSVTLELNVEVCK